MNKRSLFTSAVIGSFLLASGSAVAQTTNKIVYSYAALLDSAGNHYIPMNQTSYPPTPVPGYNYFTNVYFRFLDTRTPGAAPIVVTENSNRPGVSFAGYRVQNGMNVPTAWLIKLELVPSTGAPRLLEPATLGDKFYIAYDPALYTFESIALADPAPAIGSAPLTRRATNFADLPDFPGASWRADYSRAPVVAATTTTTTTVKPVAPSSVTGIKATVPIIKK